MNQRGEKRGASNQRGSVWVIFAVLIAVVLGAWQYNNHKTETRRIAREASQRQAEDSRREAERQQLEKRLAEEKQQRDALTASNKALDELIGRWGDAVKVAGTTGRIALSGPVNSPVWNQDAFNMMSRIDAAHAKFTLRAPRNGHLVGGRAKSMVRQMVDTFGVEKIRIRLTEESDPIELFMAPLKEAIRVELRGRYAIADKVYEELSSAYDRQEATLAPA